MGLHVSVYRFPLCDATLGGISSKANGLCLVNVSGPSSPDANDPAAMLVPGNGPGLVKIVPAVLDANKRYSPAPGWAMMGGNYAATSDSRFHEAVRKITGSASYGAVPIHDRFE
jgi:hypothetical protein